MSTKLALELIAEEKVSAIVGPNRSTYAVIVGEIAQSHGIPMMATSATNPSVTAAGDFVFMAAFTDDFQGVAMASICPPRFRGKDRRGPHAQGRCLFGGFITNLH